MDVDLPQARSLTHLIVEALERLGGQAERKEIIEKAIELGALPGRSGPSPHAL